MSGYDFDEESGWPAPAEPADRIRLQFGEVRQKKTLTNFSAGTRIGGSLFVAADEGAAVEWLTEEKPGVWTIQERLELSDFLDLAEPDEEADLEGLAAYGDRLWVLGSHARTRPKVAKTGDCIDLMTLADLKDTRARCLLARLPLVGDKKTGAPRPVRDSGDARAGLLKQDKHGNALAKALRKDPLVGPFTCIPAKEGGVDIEGIAVCGERVALGLRGPVIDTHALILEITVQTKSSGALKLRGEPAKRLLAMEGLGVRDLKRCGDDLLILAGPMTGLSGPCALYRWRDWANEAPEHLGQVRLHRPERILEIPFGRGVDHPEGLALWEGDPRRILVIYDSPASSRVDADENRIEADLFDLPD